MSGYTTSDVSELLGLTATQIRHFVRRSLVVPERGEAGEYRFSFQDVVMLRTVKSLMESRVSSRRAVRALLNVRAGLDHGKSLAALRIFADGNTVLVRADNQIWEAETGQTYFDFEQAAPALKVARIGQGDVVDAAIDCSHNPGHNASDDAELIVAREADALGSDEWYNLGLDLEDANSPRSVDAYAKAIELDPRNADAHVNLGRLLQLRGDLKQARRHYQLALDLAPSHQLALYNLGTVFDEQNELDVAADYYRRAPKVPDSHYNLSRIFELQGDELSARRHIRSYRQLLGVE